MLNIGRVAFPKVYEALESVATWTSGGGSKTENLYGWVIPGKEKNFFLAPVGVFELTSFPVSPGFAANSRFNLAHLVDVELLDLQEDAIALPYTSSPQEVIAIDSLIVDGYNINLIQDMCFYPLQRTL